MLGLSGLGGVEEGAGPGEYQGSGHLFREAVGREGKGGGWEGLTWSQAALY